MALRTELATHRETYLAAVLGGLAYSTLVGLWFVDSGVTVTGSGLDAAIGIGYGWTGLFLMAAIPIALFGRFSLVTAPLATLAILGNTVSQWLSGTHPHPLASYVIVWPLLVGTTVAVASGEALVRVVLARTTGLFELRPIR